MTSICNMFMKQIKKVDIKQYKSLKKQVGICTCKSHFNCKFKYYQYENNIKVPSEPLSKT